MDFSDDYEEWKEQLPEERSEREANATGSSVPKGEPGTLLAYDAEAHASGVRRLDKLNLELWCSDEAPYLRACRADERFNPVIPFVAVTWEQIEALASEVFQPLDAHYFTITAVGDNVLVKRGGEILGMASKAYLSGAFSAFL